MVRRVKDPEDQEVVVPAKKYQRRRCPDTCAIASCCGSREEIKIVTSVKDTKELPKPLKQNVKQNVKAAVPKRPKEVPAKKYQRRRCPDTCPRAGKLTEGCAEHGGSKLCPAGCPAKYKTRCAEHGGSRLCPAGCPAKYKVNCVEHGGTALCPAGCPAKYKTRCAEHGGTALCPAGCPAKYKSRCTEHGGSELCPAGCPAKYKSRCTEHGGSELCPAGCARSGQHKSLCAEHGGSKLCPADCPAKYKELCAEHGGSALCPADCPRNAGNPKGRCAEHGGSAKCPAGCAKNAGKAKKYCAEHGGSALCPAGCPRKYKAVCAEHGGSMLCVGCKMTRVQKRGDSCGTCVPVASFRSRVREARMAATINKWNSDGHIAEVTWCNKQNPTAEPLQCGLYRPDFGWPWNEGLLLLEFDEEKHASYPKRCELERMARVTLGHGGLPVFWIRYNPDKYKVGGKTFNTSREEREEVLLKMLKDMIGYAADYDHFMTICYLFYDKPENTHDNNNYVQKFQFKTTQEYLEWIDSVVVVPEDVVVVAD